MGDRLLIAAADETASADQLPESIRLLIEAADEILVVSPTLPSRLEWFASDTDKAKRDADDRLGKVLGKLSDLGAEAEGTIGADDPILAFEDAIARFSPTHIVIAMRNENRADWQENGLIEALWDQVKIPITFFDLPGD